MWRARRVGPRTPSHTVDANLDCAFVKKALVLVVPKIGGPFRTPSGRIGGNWVTIFLWQMRLRSAQVLEQLL